MEFLLLYLDDIDDLISSLGLVYERIRRLLVHLFTALVSLTLIAFGVWLAQSHPPLALATCLLLFVTLLYRSVTGPGRGDLQAS